jgi:hypothetical protein
MPTKKTLLVALAASAALAMGGQPLAHAEPPPLPLPITGLQAPGLPAMQSLAPAIQQAAADPTNATSMLMAAAAAFAGNSAPPDSKNMAAAVNQFVADPQVAHVPAAGTVPGAEAHLPQGIDPANAVGPAQDPPVEALAAAAPAPSGDAVPGPAPAAVPPPLSATTTQDFMYPSISNGCLADGGNVLATAISVAGPATIPSPGPAAGQTAYVFTAIGTPGPGAEQKLPLNVTWVNLTTGKSGGATLKPQADINPDGPTTLTAIVDTGSGSVMSTIFGQVTTTEKQCQFMPTIGSTVVP